MKKTEYILPALVLLFAGYLGINHFVHVACASDYLFYLTGLGILYFLTRGLLSVIPFSFRGLYLLLLFWGIAEALRGGLQLYGFTVSNHMLYKLTGTFQNPGPYAGFLAILLPLSLFILLTYTEKRKYADRLLFYSAWICFFLVLLVLPATWSRAAWLAAGTGCSLVLAIHYQLLSRIKRYTTQHRVFSLILLTTIGLILIATVAGLYDLKKDSADGRLLVWKITTRIITAHPFTGVGAGHFAGTYGQAQANYFSAHTASSREEWVADSPQYAFNEFLQMAAENGITGLLLLLAVITLAYRQAFRLRQTGVSGSLTTFLIFACFSYPFSVWQLNVLFILLLAACSTRQVPEKIYMWPSKAERYTTGGIIVLLIIPLLWTGKAWGIRQQARQHWKEAQSYYQMDIYKETVTYYRKLYPQLRHEPEFLFEFGRSLAQTGCYDESNRILREGSLLSSDPMFWNIMGKNNQVLGLYEEAEACFTRAHDMIPHRIYPLYLLANLYFSRGETDKGKAMARQIIAKEPKVKSTAIEEMKTEMKEKIRTTERQE